LPETPDDRTIRSYLLGDMPDEERAALQQRLFEDDDLFFRVRAVESDLADSLARGELAPDEAARVRAFFEESSQKHRIATARAFALMEQRKFGPTFWRRALSIAATVLITIGAIWLAVRNRQLESQIAQLTQAAPQTSIFSIRIPASTVRSSETRAPISLPPGVTTIELRLEVRAPGNRDRYRIDLTRTNGDPILTFNIPAPLPSELPVAIPRAALAPGNYEITLSAAAQPIDYYYFTIR
jgi:hypothetical protein